MEMLPSRSAPLLGGGTAREGNTHPAVTHPAEGWHVRVPTELRPYRRASAGHRHGFARLRRAERAGGANREEISIKTQGPTSPSRLTLSPTPKSIVHCHSPQCGAPINGEAELASRQNPNM